MKTFISITTNVHNEAQASELKNFLVDGMGVEYLTTDVTSDKFSIEYEELVSLLEDNEINAIYTQLLVNYLGSYMPEFVMSY